MALPQGSYIALQRLAILSAKPVSANYRRDLLVFISRYRIQVVVTINAHFDGKSIVPDAPLSPPLKAGDRLRIQIETVEETSKNTPVAEGFQPLDIRIARDLANAIALEPEFNIENS